MSELALITKKKYQSFDHSELFFKHLDKEWYRPALKKNSPKQFQSFGNNALKKELIGRNSDIFFKLSMPVRTWCETLYVSL